MHSNAHVPKQTLQQPVKSTTQIFFPYRVNFLLPNETLSEIEAKRFTEAQKIRRHELNCKISSSKLFLAFLLIYVLALIDIPFNY
jgi:hypothetical protein